MTRYELRDRIGVGGMAEVFRGKAVAAGGFEKPVAIKRILPHLAQDERFVELLIREAKVLSLLKHRNIVQIFDVGLGDDGKYFLVMEYVDGKDLGAIQRGLEARRLRIPFDLALHIGAEICEALEHAHSSPGPDGLAMAVVHRDVSPSNVLLSRAGETKLTDFGIAKRAEQEATGHGAVRGKCAYISPEQARNERLEPRSDVFSVGILLWELVTGRRLFSGLADLEALRSVREAKAPRPSDLDPRLSPEVDGLILSALAAEPRGRPTAGQLGAQLRNLRYSLEVTVGDPATELAKIIDTVEDIEKESAREEAAKPARRIAFDGNDVTVIRIHTADAFSMRDKDGSGLARARAVIDRFEEEETRQAKLSRDQMAFLRANARRDSQEIPPPDPRLPGMRARPPTDEPTRSRAPLQVATEDLPTTLPAEAERSPRFDDADATRLVAPMTRRTPQPERAAARHATDPPAPPPFSPPASARPYGATPAPALRTPTPGTRERNLRPAGSPAPISAAQAMHPAPPAPTLPPLASAGPSAPALLPPSPALLGAPGPGMTATLSGTAVPPTQASWLSPRLPTTPSAALGFSDRALPGRRAVSHPPQVVKRRTPLKPWTLGIGALVMALLAFAVTRACIHGATSSTAGKAPSTTTGAAPARPASESK